MIYARSSCGGCTAARMFGWLGEVAPVARAHEAIFGHQVTVWDSPTSQVTRSLWTPLPAPVQVAPAVETAVAA